MLYQAVWYDSTPFWYGFSAETTPAYVELLRL
jgi:hypothetical protein